MSFRDDAVARVAESRELLRQAAGISITVPLVSLLFARGLAITVPFIAVFDIVAYWRYRRAKRALAALDEPPTARLLR